MGWARPAKTDEIVGFEWSVLKNARTSLGVPDVPFEVKPTEELSTNNFDRS
jgi:hypothetical protein